MCFRLSIARSLSATARVCLALTLGIFSAGGAERTAKPSSSTAPQRAAGGAPEPAPLFEPGEPPPAGEVSGLPREAPRVPLRAPNAQRPQMLWMEGRQFVVWGGAPASRSALFTAACAVRREVLEALRQPDRWTYPVVLQIREPHAQPPGKPQVWTEISQVALSETADPTGFRIEINLVPQLGVVPGPLLKRNLVRAILAEMILRGNEKVNFPADYEPPPDWLLAGTLELLDYRELGRLSDSFARVYRLGRVLSVEEIFEADADGMDSVSETIFRVSSCGLLMTLLDQPKGDESFAAMLSRLGRSPGKDEAAVLSSFPALAASSNSLGKWWSLRIATLAQPSLDELLTPAETEKQLAEALVLRARPPAAAKGKPSSGLKKLFGRGKQGKEKPADDGAPATMTEVDVRNFATLMNHPERRDIFDQAALRLTKVQMRAHPLYRPILRDYLDLLNNLADGKKTREAPATLERLAATRARLSQHMQAVEDYLDWYLADQVPWKSGEFTNYLEAAEELAQPPPPGEDPIGAYLDAVEREFSEAE